MSSTPDKTYLGDSVYVAYCGGGAFILTTENGMGPSNTIVLEPEVYMALVNYGDRHWPYDPVPTPPRTGKAAPDLLAACDELIEICRWKCTAQDSVVLKNGKTNHQALIDACAVITKAKGQP